MDLQWLGLILPGAYLIISTVFLCFPTLLRKKARYSCQIFNQLIDSDKLLCIGHRGGGFEGPENTMQVFRKTAGQSHMFELDICTTKDGQLVVHHDSNLRRTCGVSRDISELDYAQLPTYMGEFESFGGGPMATTHNKIPLLDQLFQEFPETPMNIDLKTPSQEAIIEFKKLVKKHNREHLTIWGVAKDEMNDKLRESDPTVPNFYSGFEVFKIFLLCITGLLPFACLRHGVLDVPLIGEEFQKLGYSFANTGCKKCLVFFLLLLFKFFGLMSRLFVPHLKKRGILTFFWILNSEEDFARAVAIGASGIMTDRPTILAAYLKSRSLYCERMSDSF